jgi:hypothetical protein
MVEEARYTKVDSMALRRVFRIVVLFCISAGTCAASQMLDRETPNWVQKVVPDLTRSRTGISPRLIDENRAGVVFVNDGQLITYAVVHDGGGLSLRDSPEPSSPFRLHVWLLDAESGRSLFARYWNTRGHDSAVKVTSGGVLIKTGEVVKLYSSDFATARNLVLPRKNGMIVVSVSPTGKTIMINDLSQKLNGSHFWVLDGSTLKEKYSWSESPPLYHSYSISDMGIAAVDFSSHSSIIVSAFGSRIWKSVGKATGLCSNMNMPTLYSDQQLIYGCDQLIAMSLDGHILMTEPFPMGNFSSGKTVVTRGGRFAAVALDTIEVKTHLFTEPSSRVTATHIAVYDLLLKKRIATVNVDPMPKNDFDFALSPDGSKLAVLNDENLALYSISDHGN